LGKSPEEFGGEAASDALMNVLGGPASPAMLIGLRAKSSQTPQEIYKMNEAVGEAVNINKTQDWRDVAVKTGRKYGWFMTPDHAIQRWINEGNWAAGEVGTKAAGMLELQKYGNVRLKDAWKSKILDEYPQIGEILLKTAKLKGMSAGVDRERGIMYLDKDLMDKRWRESSESIIAGSNESLNKDIIHETAHIVGVIENWSTGATPKFYENHFRANQQSSPELTKLATRVVEQMFKEAPDLRYVKDPTQLRQAAAEQAYYMTLDEMRARTAEQGLFGGSEKTFWRRPERYDLFEYEQPVIRWPDGSVTLSVY